MGGMYPGAMYPGMDLAPHHAALSQERGTLAELVAQILMQKKMMDAEQEARISDKVATYDPMEVYRRYGSGLPHLMGLSAMQRYRDMGLRQNATAEAAKAAVAAKQREQEQLAAVNPLAASNITKTVGPILNGQPTEVLSSRYGTGRNDLAPAATNFTVDGRHVGGADLQEFFQRAVNAGSPNAAAIGMAPEPGYQGVPMSKSDEELWRKTMRRVAR